MILKIQGVSEDKALERHMKNAILIWNPSTGEYFNCHDNFCPLQKVWTAIGRLNVCN